ncbi:MAG: phenylalanine--tRNA ligase subunit alpha [Candidatus Micrarchaeia archaeon]
MALHRYEALLLRVLSASGGSAGMATLVEKSKLGKDAVQWALESLAEKNAVRVEREEEREVALSDEAKSYAASALPEDSLLERLRKGPVRLSELRSEPEQIGMRWLKAKGLARIADGMLLLTEQGSESKGTAAESVLKQLAKNPSQETLKRLMDTNAAEIKELESRHLISITKRQRIIAAALSEKGKELAKQAETEAQHASEITTLTKEMIASGSWKGARFSSYNLQAQVEGATPAREHVFRRLANQLRLAYLANGFTEIRGPIVEPAFWVFDYLFVPQDHPAREVQDTFFTETPRELPVNDKALVKTVKRSHEEGWHMDWREDVARQAVLRTQTTNVTGRYIYKIVSALNKNKYAYALPVKLFTIGRVFRNENLDYKHLADFYQTDGIIIGENLTLAKLFDTLLKLYKAIGIEVRFKPSYFPFVEPGVEVDMRFGGEWLEMGGAGIIRREIVGNTKKNINVLAWGLGMERIVLAKNKNIKSIVDLYSESVGWLRNNSV